MNAIGTKINYFKSRRDDARHSEKVLKELIQNEESTVGSIKRAEQEFKMKDGQFGDEFSEWLKGLGLKENVHLLDVIELFWNKKVIEIT